MGSPVLALLLIMPRPTKEKSEEKALMQITKDVVSESPDIASLGLIIGCLGSDVKALQKLKKEAGSVEEFLSLAGELANVSLVASATKAAIGYDVDEVQTEYANKVNPVYAYGTKDQVLVKEVETGRKVTRKHIRPSEALLKFLLSNRLPQYFSDTRKVEINKTVKEIKADTEEEIKAFAGKLLEAVTVDAEWTDADSE